jgi:D-threo-aldose 1-dehydrogenase
MIYREIGSTGIHLPPVVFGTSALGNLYTALDDNVKLEIVREAFRHVPGTVVFDSAGKYGAGLALEKLGECLHRLEIDPQRVVISNKLGWKRIPLTTPEPTFEAGVWKDLKNDAIQDISYEGILSCYEQGNLLLGRKYAPQLVSVHDPDEYLDAAESPDDRKLRMANIVDAYRALSELKAQGKVKAIGVGAKNWKIIRELHQLVELDWVMFANSMTILHHPQELIDFMGQLRNENISIVNSAVFHAGFLIGGNYFDYRLIQPDSDENRRLFDWRNRFFELCRSYDLQPSLACVQFGLAAPGVTSIALNTSKPANIKANVDAVLTPVPTEFWMDMKNEGMIGSQVDWL